MLGNEVHGTDNKKKDLTRITDLSVFGKRLRIIYRMS